MKILVICQYYGPEPVRIVDTCEELVKCGHEVQVVCQVPNYPEGVFYSGYSNSTKRDEIINGVKVHRVCTLPRRTGVVHRFLNYYSYSLAATHFVNSGKCLAADGNPFDVVLVNQLSPVMMAEPAIAYKKKYGARVVMYCMDLWPESLIAGGIKRGSLPYRYYHRVSNRIYRSMDKILVTSRMFIDYLQEQFSIPSNKLEYLPQYAEAQFNDISPKEPSPDGSLHLMFAGNIGAMQSVDTILKAAEILKEENIFWHIVGSGSELENMQNYAREHKLEKVIFYGRRPLEEMPKFYAMADAMLVTLKADPVISLTLPGKVQTYMAAGKPIIGAINGETTHIINQARCGICSPAEDELKLVESISAFRFSNCADYGNNSMCFFEKEFRKEIYMKKLLFNIMQE